MLTTPQFAFTWWNVAFQNAVGLFGENKHTVVSEFVHRNLQNMQEPSVKKNQWYILLVNNSDKSP